MSKLVFTFLCIFAIAAGKSAVPTIYTGAFYKNPVMTPVWTPTYRPHEQSYMHNIPMVTASRSSNIPVSNIRFMQTHGIDFVDPAARSAIQVFHTPITQTVPAHATSIDSNIITNVIPTQHSFHSQDDFGGYSFGYYGGPVSRMEHKDQFGNVVGSYNYIDAEGKVQRAKYTAGGKDGFKIIATNLPVHDTRHMVHIEDSDDVKKAKAEFRKAFNERLIISRKKRDADPAFHYSSSILPAESHQPIPQFYSKPLTFPIMGKQPVIYQTTKGVQMSHPQVYTSAQMNPVFRSSLVPNTYPTIPTSRYVQDYSTFVQNVQVPHGVSPISYQTVPYQVGVSPLNYQSVAQHVMVA